MLDWFKSRLRREQAAHPLQTEKGLQDVLDGIPWHSPAAAVPEVGNWLQSVDELKGSSAAGDIVRAVRRLDEAAQGTLEACRHEMMGKAGEDIQEAPWLALAAYYEHLLAAYRLALDTSLEDPRLADNRNALALLAVRAMAALMARKLLLRLRYRHPDAEFWCAAHDLLALGRTRALAHLRVTPYGGAEAATLLSEYLVGALLEVAPIENLTQPQMICAQRLIAHHRHGILFREEPGATVPYYVDIEGDQGPLRAAPPGERPASARFVGVGKVGPYVFSLMKDAALRTDVPEAAADSGCGMEDYRQLLRTLSDHWLGHPPQRRHTRRKTDAELLAVNGFAQVRRMVAASCFARSGRRLSYKTYLEMMAHHSSRFGHVRENAPQMPEDDLPVDKMATLQQLETAGDRELMEQWSLLDVSEQGFGAVLSHHRRWLRVGALVGFRPRGSADWRVGIVRRIGRSGHGRRAVGVEVLPGTPISVQYVPLDSNERSPWGAVPEFMTSAWHDAILVSTVTRSMLVARGKYAPNRPVRVVFEGDFSYLRLLALVEQGKDFELVTYEEMASPPDGSAASGAT